MGWTAGELPRRFTSRAAIAFDLGDEFAGRVFATARHGTVIYVAVRAREGSGVFGLVLLAERRDGLLYTKPISEDMGPAEDGCPARILDLLTRPANEYAEEWRERCRARLPKPRPKADQVVIFTEALEFTDGSAHRILKFEGGSRFRSRDGALYRVSGWKDRDYRLGAESGATR
jgi:hypothetical protein